MKKEKIYKSVLRLAIVFILFLVLFGCAKESESQTSDSNQALRDYKVETETGTYLGNVENDFFSGKGTMYFNDGIVYSGNWKDSKFQGDGTISYPEVGTYSGSFNESQREGEGTFTWNDGGSLTGTWKNDKIIEGKLSLPDGTLYNGGFSEGKFDDGSLQYSFKNDAAEDIAIIITYSDQKASHITYRSSSGFEYDGPIQGRGNADIKYQKGDTYSGEVNNELREGNGLYVFYENNVAVAKYNGNWVQDSMQGEGVYYYTSGDLPKIEGEFEENVPKGSCIYTDGEGSRFMTVWENGKCTDAIWKG